MRLNLQPIIYKDGTSLPFDFSMDLSEAELYGEFPVQAPVRVSGMVRNRAGSLSLEGEAVSELSLRCDRCGGSFHREKRVALACLLAQELEAEEEDEIVLLEDGGLDVGDLAYSAFLLDMDIQNLCSEDCRGLCAGCGVNLNEEECRCKPELDPRWAALSQLLPE